MSNCVEVRAYVGVWDRLTPISLHCLVLLIVLLEVLRDPVRNNKNAEGNKVVVCSGEVQGQWRGHILSGSLES